MRLKRQAIGVSKRRGRRARELHRGQRNPCGLLHDFEAVKGFIQAPTERHRAMPAEDHRHMLSGRRLHRFAHGLASGHRIGQRHHLAKTEIDLRQKARKADPGQRVRKQDRRMGVDHRLGGRAPAIGREMQSKLRRRLEPRGQIFGKGLSR